jgi:nitrite reductase/ring-hydroxylating ferredoxin subunit
MSDRLHRLASRVEPRIGALVQRDLEIGVRRTERIEPRGRTPVLKKTREVVVVLIKADTGRVQALCLQLPECRHKHTGLAVTRRCAAPYAENGGMHDVSEALIEDRCPHHRAALSPRRKEGDALRCMYHGMKFAPDGKCIEIPRQTRINESACAHFHPVVERNNCIWAR